MYDSTVSRYFTLMKELLNEPKHNFSQASSKQISEEQGVYAIYDKKVNAIIYVGRTKNLKRRLLSDHRRGNVEGSQFRKTLSQNFALNSESQITSYILDNCSFQFMVIKEFEEMVRLEHFMTAILAPVLNIKLKQ